MGFALRYKLENLAHYGKQGTERLSEYRGYSHGLKRGWIVSLTSLIWVPFGILRPRQLDA